MPTLSSVSRATEGPATRIYTPSIAYGNGGRRLTIDTPGRPPTSCVFAVEVIVSYKDDDGRSILLLQPGSRVSWRWRMRQALFWLEYVPRL
jgi:hypothetical protein